ncbi:MAG: hypothetical protein U1F43_23635 [Myxococcota bacterium]
MSAERIFDELTRILGQGHAERGIELLATSGLLVAVLPEVAGVPPMVERAREQLARAPTASDVGAWGALLYELPAETVQAIALRLKSSRAFRRRWSRPPPRPTAWWPGPI